MVAQGPENTPKIPTVIDQNMLIPVFEAYLRLQKSVNNYDITEDAIHATVSKGLCSGLSAFMGDRLDANPQKIGEIIEELNKSFCTLKALHDKLTVDSESFKIALLQDGEGKSDAENLTYKNNKTVALLEEMISHIIMLQGVHPLHSTLQWGAKRIHFTEAAKQDFLTLISEPVNAEAVHNWAQRYAEICDIDINTLILTEQQLQKIKAMYHDPQQGPEKAIQELEWIVQNNQPGNIRMSQRQGHQLINIMAKEVPKESAEQKKHLDRTFQTGFIYKKEEVLRALTLLFGSLDPKSNMIIELSTEGHATVAYKAGNHIYYWDPNCGDFWGPLPLANAAEIIAQWMIERIYINSPEAKKGRYPLSIEIYEQPGSAANALSSPDIVNTILTERGVDADSHSLINAGMLRAARIGDLALVTFLTNEKGANVNAKNQDGWSVMSCAISDGQTEVVEFLATKIPIDTEEEDHNNVTALHSAAIQGNIDIVRVLLKAGASVSKKTKKGHTALHIAVQNGYLWIAQLLLTYHADLNDIDNQGRTALHIAAINGHVAVVQWLLKQENLKVNITDLQGKTALHLAADMGNIEIMQTLLGAGAKIDAPSLDGNTALHLACKQGKIEVVEALLAAGANTALKNVDGYTALHLAAQAGNLALVKRLFNEANAAQKDNTGCTLLHLAAQNGHSAVVEWLLRQPGVKINEPENNGWTPLHLAAKKGDVGSLAMLAVLGADLSAKDIKGNTALHLVAEAGTLGVLNILLIYNKMYNKKLIEAQNTNGQTALDCAVFYDYPQIVDLLLQHGADVYAVDPLLLAGGASEEVRQLLFEKMEKIQELSLADSKINPPENNQALSEEIQALSLEDDDALPPMVFLADCEKPSPMIFHSYSPKKENEGEKQNSPKEEKNAENPDDDATPGTTSPKGL